MKIDNLVTKIETSERLIKSGVKIHTALSYYKNKSGNSYIDFTDFSNNEIMFPAFTSEELIQILPNDIKLNEEHYIFDNEKNSKTYKTYKKFKKSIEDEYPFANLECLKTDNTEETLFITRYPYKNVVIATSVNKKGEHETLIRIGDTEAESRAEMYLLLKSENIL